MTDPKVLNITAAPRHLKNCLNCLHEPEWRNHDPSGVQVGCCSRFWTISVKNGGLVSAPEWEKLHVMIANKSEEIRFLAEASGQKITRCPSWEADC